MAIDNLFGVIFAPFAEVAEVQKTQLQNEEQKIRIAADSMALQNQQAFQKAMAEQFPIGGIDQAINGATAGDRASTAKLNALVSIYGQYAPDKLPQLMSTLEMADYRKTLAQDRRRQEVGSIFSSVDSPEAYAAAAPEIQAMGGYKAFGLTGNYAVDASRIQMLGAQGLTAQQKIQADQRAQTERDRVDAQQERARQQQENMDLRTQMEASRERHRTQMEAFKAAQEARAQAGLEFNQEKTLATLRNKVSKVSNDDLKLAMSFVNQNETTKDLPANMKQVLARDLAQKAKNKVASGVKDVGSLPDEDTYSNYFSDSLNELMKENKLVKEYRTLMPSGLPGENIRIPGTDKYKYKPERPTVGQRQEAMPQRRAEIPTASGPSDLAGYDVGQEFYAKGKKYRKVGPDNYKEVQ